MIELYTEEGLNLVKKDDPFFQFPDGQWHMNNTDFTGNEVAYVKGTDLNDYMKLMLWSGVIPDNLGNVVIPYFPGARSDKLPLPSGAAYAYLIPDSKKIIVFDVHSPFVLDFLKIERPNQKIVHVAASEILKKYIPFNHHRYDGIIAPDAGAHTRANAVAESLHLPLYEAGKHRDQATGALSGFDSSKLPLTGNYLIVDDICDGGGTFNGLVDEWRNKGFTGTVDLYVSHGIFSKGFVELNSRFGKIITTDSIFDYWKVSSKWAMPFTLEIIPVKEYLLNKI